MAGAHISFFVRHANRPPRSSKLPTGEEAGEAKSLRKGALFGLRWNNIDCDKGFITLRGDVAKKGKTERIPLNQHTRNTLEKLPRVCEYVFLARNGGQRKVFAVIARRVRERAGLPANFRPLHGLRHTFASAMASTGKVQLYTLQQLLTHNSPLMTQRYAHLADEALKKAAEVSDNLFNLNPSSEIEVNDEDIQKLTFCYHP